MKLILPRTQMSALAYLHDHVRDLPGWFCRLTVRQLEDIAEVMVQWNISTENQSALPMEEIEKREVLRVLAMCEGRIPRAAKLLKMGKTTIYRKLTHWGYSVQSRTSTEQASSSRNRRRTGRRNPLKLDGSPVEELSFVTSPDEAATITSVPVHGHYHRR
jgi:hypothetical protein